MIKPTPAPKVIHSKLLFLPYMYAIFLIGLVGWQLVMFERFAPYVAGYLDGNLQNASVVAMILIGLELFALPFLLRMQLSPLARFFSAAFAFMAPLAWAALTMMSDSFNAGYLLLNVSFFAWAGISFWVLGGQSAMRLARP